MSLLERPPDRPSRSRVTPGTALLSVCCLAGKGKHSPKQEALGLGGQEGGERPAGDWTEVGCWWCRWWWWWCGDWKKLGGGLGQCLLSSVAQESLRRKVCLSHDSPGVVGRWETVCLASWTCSSCVWEPNEVQVLLRAV